MAIGLNSKLMVVRIEDGSLNYVKVIRNLPSIDWLKLNTLGSFCGQSQWAGCGSVLLDS